VCISALLCIGSNTANNNTSCGATDKQADASFYLGEILMGLGGKFKAEAILGSADMVELTAAPQSDVMIVVRNSCAFLD
jgi:hypothetical protein